VAIAAAMEAMETKVMETKDMETMEAMETKAMETKVIMETKAMETKVIMETKAMEAITKAMETTIADMESKWNHSPLQSMATAMYIRPDTCFQS